MLLLMLMRRIGLRVSKHYPSSLSVSPSELQSSPLTFRGLGSLKAGSSVDIAKLVANLVPLGDYVTLGAWERLDIQAVVEYLREEGASYPRDDALL